MISKNESAPSGTSFAHGKVNINRQSSGHPGVNASDRRLIYKYGYADGNNDDILQNGSGNGNVIQSSDGTANRTVDGNCKSLNDSINRDKEYKSTLSDNSFYMWYKEAETPHAEILPSSYKDLLLYPGEKEVVYSSKHIAYISLFTAYLAFAVTFLLFAPQIFKTYLKLPEINHSEPPIVNIAASASVNKKDVPPAKQDNIVKQTKDSPSLVPEPVRKKISDNVILKTQKELNNIQSPVSDKSGPNVYSGGNFVKIDKGAIDKRIDKTIKTQAGKQTYDAFEVEVQPVCINLSQVKVKIEYPKLAQERGTQGMVMVKVLVDENGNIAKVGAMSGPEIFYDVLKKKVQNLVFTPGLQNNKAVKVWVTVPFLFKLT